jgi:hypothetical protein
MQMKYRMSNTIVNTDCDGFLLLGSWLVLRDTFFLRKNQEPGTTFAKLN